MEISQISSGQTFSFPTAERAPHAVRNQGDVVDLHGAQLLADDEVEDVLNETMSMIASDSGSALTVHSGLSESRVFALLGL